MLSSTRSRTATQALPSLLRLAGAGHEGLPKPPRKLTKAYDDFHGFREEHKQWVARDLGFRRGLKGFRVSGFRCI